MDEDGPSAYTYSQQINISKEDPSLYTVAVEPTSHNRRPRFLKINMRAQASPLHHPQTPQYGK
jgi:hypothetical protein